MADTRISQLEKTVSRIPGRCSAVDDGVWRCEQRFKEQDAEPYAVIYLDLRGRLPASPNDLLGIEEKYLAKGFFEGPKHLKWNHYLVFAIPDAKWKEVSDSETRKWIEKDTTYAKKMVVADESVEGLFAQEKWDVGASEKLEAPRETWLNALAPLKLDQLLFSKTRAPAVKKWIETGEVDAVVPGTERAAVLGRSNDIGKLAEIKWAKFRQWPLPKNFQFSEVNLIRGVNGVGKTSLLEAVEMFYCGEIHRGGTNAVVNDVSGRFDGENELKKLPASEADKRGRDLRWFGAYWRQKQELASSFNRYIFFNSDAAFELQQSGDSQQVASALMNVALGEDATVLWGRIKEYSREIENQTLQLKTKSAGFKYERDVAKRESDKLAQMPMVAEKTLKLVQAESRTLGWRKLAQSVEDFENDFWPTIVDAQEHSKVLESLPRKVSTFKQVDETLEVLKQRFTRLQNSFRKTDAEEKRLQDLQSSGKRLLPKNDALRRLGEYVSVGWLGAWCRYKEDSLATEQLLSIQKQTRSLNYDVLATLDAQKSIGLLLRDNSEALSAGEKELQRLKKRSDVLRQRVSEFQAIVSEAKSLGQRLIEMDPKTLECPLCGQVHEPGALKHKIERRRASTGLGDTALTEVSEQIATIEKQNRRLSRVTASITIVQGLLGDPLRAIAFVRQSESLGNILVRLQGVDRLFDEASERVRALSRTLKVLEDKGFDETEFRGTYEEVFRGEIKETSGWAETFKSRVKSEQDSVAKVLADSGKEIASVEQKIISIRREISQLLSGYGSGEDYEQRQELMESDIEVLGDARREIIELRKLCEIDSTVDLKAFGKKLTRLYSLARELVGTMSEEKARRQSMSSLDRRIRENNKELNQIKPKVERADKGIALFKKIMKEYSIEKLLERFIDENHKRISSILVDIHAPKEFIGLESWSGGGGIRLIRNDQAKTRADLTQVSTGQRSAIALAIFLTLNEKLKTAPPLIMLDDPVAHVDDLNMLAFLDYLREIALTRTRQIFFATANDKVAAIFQQKFSPLVGDFRPIDLSR